MEFLLAQTWMDGAEGSYLPRHPIWNAPPEKIMFSSSYAPGAPGFLRQ
jgi:hypothetical protein